MKFILTNDDGIDAPGLEVLHRIVSGFGETVIVAPKDPLSGISHKVTVHSPINVFKTGENRFSISGTPADCARIGLKVIAPDADYVISGINPGANLGSDIYNSGTIAAAREAAILGCKSIAVSQYIAKDHQVDWEITSIHAARIIEVFIHKILRPGYFWNINLPHPLTPDTKPVYQFCNVDTHPHAYKYRQEGNAFHYEGIIHNRPRNRGSDVEVCFDGHISVTRMSLDMKEYHGEKR